VELVVRRRSEKDRRLVYLGATSKARELEEQVMPIVTGTYAELRASIDTSVWDQLIAALIEVSAMKPTASK